MIRILLVSLKLKGLFETKFVSPDYAESMPSYPVFTPEIDCQDKGIHISIEDYESQESISYTPGYNEPNESYLALIDNDNIIIILINNNISFFKITSFLNYTK